MEIFPAIDLREGKCVRLLQGDYDRQIDYADDPVAVAKEFEQAGAAWLHMVDLDGAREGRRCNQPTIEKVIKQTSLRVQIGGGLRETETIESLIEAGVSRCVVGTRALEDWPWFQELVHRPAYRDHIVLGLDARGGQLAKQGWTKTTTQTAVQVARQVAGWPLAAIVYTDIARDGMLIGPNIEAIEELAAHSTIPVVASGGVTSIDDVRRLVALPLGGIIIGRAIYEKQINLTEALRVARSA